MLIQVEENFNKLKGGLIDNLNIATSTFVEQLKARTYTKVTHTSQAPSSCGERLMPGTASEFRLCLCLPMSKRYTVLVTLKPRSLF